MYNQETEEDVHNVISIYTLNLLPINIASKANKEPAFSTCT